MPTLCPFQHASNDAHFDVNDRWAYAAATTPFPEPQNIICRNSRKTFLAEKFARLGQKLSLFFLAGLTQL
jgi:hypothetical protein